MGFTVADSKTSPTGSHGGAFSDGPVTLPARAATEYMSSNCNVARRRSATTPSSRASR